QGRTAAVGLSLAETEELLQPYEGRLAIAANNSPGACTISGDPEAVEEVLAKLQERRIFARKLPVDLAFHSQHMDKIKDLLAAELKNLRPARTQIPIYSTVTGNLISGDELDADYWRNNVRQTVQFASAMAKLAGQKRMIYLELSPHPVLAANIG